jgi:hypothetical protein
MDVIRGSDQSILNSMPWYKGLLLFVLLISITGCGKISGSIKSLAPNGINDFLKSQILVNGPGVADGTTALVVLLRLMNSNNTIVVGFQPDYRVLSGTGLSPAACSISDNTGTSVCLLRSTMPGVKRIKIGNIDTLSLEKDVTFNPKPISKNIFTLASGGGKGTGIGAASGYQVQASITHLKTSNKTTVGGYTIYSGFQPAVSPPETIEAP